MTNPLAELHADLLHAARVGGEQAGHAAVEAGVHHNDNAGRALFNQDMVHSQFLGELDAQVTAVSTGASPYGPSLPATDGTADVMADIAAQVGAAAALPDRR